MQKINIAIDGYSSCGKGTLARFLANTLHYRFVDTGAMYRAVTLFFIKNGVDLGAEDQVQKALSEVFLGFEFHPENEMYEITLNGKNVEREIRNMEVAAQVSHVARISAVRSFLVQQQQALALEKGVVMDGRDIGTVVIPNAELKIFMTAKPEIRAERRLAELERAGVKTTYEDVLQNLLARDRIDSSRNDSPLTLRADYKVLDNSNISRQEQNDIAMQWVHQILP